MGRAIYPASGTGQNQDLFFSFSFFLLFFFNLQTNFIQQKDDVIISNQDKGHYSSFAPTCVFLWCPLPSAFPVATRVGGQARRGCKVTSRVHTFQKCSFHSSTTKVIRVTRVELCSPRLSLRGSAMSLDQTGLENGHRWSSQVRK